MEPTTFAVIILSVIAVLLVIPILSLISDIEGFRKDLDNMELKYIVMRKYMWANIMRATIGRRCLTNAALDAGCKVLRAADCEYCDKLLVADGGEMCNKCNFYAEIKR